MSYIWVTQKEIGHICLGLLCQAGSYAIKLDYNSVFVVTMQEPE